MDLDKTIEKYFLEDAANVLKWGDTIKENIKKISFEYKLDLSPYMTKLYVVDKKGYFKGFVDFGINKGITPEPNSIYNNQGKLLLKYKRKGNFWETLGEQEDVPKEKAIKYIIDNSNNIKSFLFKVKKNLHFNTIIKSSNRMDLRMYRKDYIPHKNFKNYFPD